MDERAKKVVRLSLEAIIPLIKDSKALSSICITNEPIFRTAISDDFFRPYWADYLNDIYSGDISKLNYNYGTTYQSFDEVEFPEINTYGNSISISDARDYDYCNFNAVILSTWHKFICDTIREMAPNVPLHSKIHLVPKSTDWHSSMRSSLDAGVYYQYHANLFDLNGNDGGTYLTNQWKLRELDYEQQIDYQKTFKTAPIVNSEDHILQDRMAGFEPIHSDSAAWQI